MSREEIELVIKKCDAYIEDLKKFRECLEVVMGLSTLTPEMLAEWKEQMPDSFLVEAMLDLLPEEV